MGIHDDHRIVNRDDTRSAESRQWLHFRRWLRSPKGIFSIILLVLTVPAATASGWTLILPNLLAAIVTAALLDVPLLRWRDGTWSFPDGAMLTGWLVGIILSPHLAWTVAGATAAIGIAAKHLLRVKRANVLNPAAAALVASYLLLDTGQSWWGALPELPPAAIALVAGTAGFMAWRLHKLPLVLTMLGVHFTCATVAAFAGDPSRVVELYRTPDVHMALFFAGFMATDPPTSPPKYGDQMIYGAIAALAAFALYLWVGAVYFLPGGLLIANLWEGWRKWQRTGRRHHPAPTSRIVNAQVRA